MPTARSVTSMCSARAALAGNPSDGYGGAVVAIPIDDLCAVASATDDHQFSVETADAETERLLRATARAFVEHSHDLPTVRLAASTTIPKSVGLGGSSAIVIAALRSLAACAGHRWAPIELAELALAVERDFLDITAGLQDRLVQAVDRPVSMTFDPVTFDVLAMPHDWTLFVAWDQRIAAPSDTVHRSIRRRFAGGDPRLLGIMQALADQATAARRAIESGDLAGLGAAMDRSFDLRTEMVDVEPPQHRLVQAGRAAGAWVNSAGSGGSVVGLLRPDISIETLAGAYRGVGAEFIPLG